MKQIHHILELFQNLNNILATFFGYFLFRLISYVSKIFYQKEALGLGDALLVAGIGSWSGLCGVGPSCR